MTEFSKNILTEPMSRKERARVLGVQSVCAALGVRRLSEGFELHYEQPAEGVGYTDRPTDVVPAER